MRNPASKMSAAGTLRRTHPSLPIVWNVPEFATSIGEKMTPCRESDSAPENNGVLPLSKAKGTEIAMYVGEEARGPYMGMGNYLRRR